MNTIHTTETLASRAAEADELARSVRETAIDALQYVEANHAGEAAERVAGELRSIVAGLANLAAKCGSLAVELDDPQRALRLLHELAARVSGQPPQDPAELLPSRPRMFVHGDTGAVVVVFPGGRGGSPELARPGTWTARGVRRPGELVGPLLELDGSASTLGVPS